MTLLKVLLKLQFCLFDPVVEVLGMFENLKYSACIAVETI